MVYNCVGDETSPFRRRRAGGVIQRRLGTTRIPICQLAISPVAEGVVVALDAKQCGIKREKL